MKFLTLLTLLLVTLTLVKTLKIPSGGQEVLLDDHEDDTAEDNEDDDVEDKKSTTSTTPLPTFPPDKTPTNFYHNQTKKYYEELTQGPCPNNLMYLRASDRPDEVYGICGCHQASVRGSESFVPQVYHHPTKKCYHIYRQGYCKENQWLVYTGRVRFGCVENPCVKSNLNPEKVVLLNDKCVELGDSCPSEEGNFIVAFRHFDLLPTCAESLIIV